MDKQKRMPSVVMAKVGPLFQRKLRNIKTRASRFNLKSKKVVQSEATSALSGHINSVYVCNGTVVIANTDVLEGQLWMSSQPKILYKGTLSPDRGLELQDCCNPWFDLNPVQSKELLCDSASSSGDSAVTRVDDGLNEWGLPKCLIGEDNQESQHLQDNVYQVAAEEKTEIGTENVKHKKITLGLYKKQRLLIVVVFVIVIIAKHRHARHMVRSRRVFSRAKVSSRARVSGKLHRLEDAVNGVGSKRIVSSCSYLSGLTLVGENTSKILE